jgi:probable phosphoglycerate mutase
MRILLARHGETAWNAEGRYQGQEDIPLSVAGEQQARRLGERLRDVRIDRAVCSPLARTRQTAQFALGELRSAMLTADKDLMEIAHGRWEGKLASEIEVEDPERFRAWRETPDKVTMPEGESLVQVLERAWPALARAGEGMAEAETLLVMAHDAVNRVLLCRVLGLPPCKLWSFRQAPTTLNLLQGPDVDHLEVVRLNDCSHHTLLFGESVHRAL